jgi:hypothetical protein
MEIKISRRYAFRHPKIAGVVPLFCILKFNSCNIMTVEKNGNSKQGIEENLEEIK